MTADIERKLFAITHDFSKANKPQELEFKVYAEQRKVKFTIYSHSWDNLREGKEFHYPHPQPYKIAEYLLKISQFIQNNDHTSLEDWLKSYFLYQKPVVDKEEEWEYGRERTLENYKIYKIRPLMEVLIFNSVDIFTSLLDATQSKPECRKAFMNSFEHLNLAGAYLDNLDLSNANFKNTNLTGAHFENTVLTNADLSFTQLKNVSGLTPEQLDSCATYEKAILPKHIWPYWDKEIKSNIGAGLEDLKNYGTKLQDNKETKAKGLDICNHAEEMLHELDKAENTKVEQSFKESFVRKLNSKDFNHPRDHGVKMILTNISLFILGAGVGYIIAGAIHKAYTGRFLFFSRTTTQEKIDKVISYVPGMRLGRTN